MESEVAWGCISPYKLAWLGFILSRVFEYLIIISLSLSFSKPLKGWKIGLGLDIMMMKKKKICIYTWWVWGGCCLARHNYSLVCVFIYSSSRLILMMNKLNTTSCKKGVKASDQASFLSNNILLLNQKHL